MRAPSALSLIAAVPVAYFALRRLIGERPALASAAFVAVNPLLVNYSTDARSYALLVLTALLSVWGLTAVLESGHQRAYAGWALASVACVWTHYFGAFTVLGEALVLLVLRPEQRRLTLAWCLAIAVCAAPLIPLLMRQNASEDSAFIAGISLVSRVEQTARQFGMGANVPTRFWGRCLTAEVLLADYFRRDAASRLSEPGTRQGPSRARRLARARAAPPPTLAVQAREWGPASSVRRGPAT